MNVFQIVILAFAGLEFLNILLLYFAPESKRGNALGYFKAYESSKKDAEVHALVKYLTNWVAGTKLIFIALLLVIVFKGDSGTHYFTLIALLLSILSFFWRLFPIIRRMDADDQLTQKGYSKTLGLMISGMILVFSLVLLFDHFQS